MTDRKGLTLLEVILSVAIFAGSIAVVSKLMEIGSRAAQYNQLMTRAVILAESKLGEIVAGITPIGSTGQTFVEDPAWQWQLTSSQGAVPGVVLVTVTVYPASNGELARGYESIEYSLSRWVLDPAYVQAVEEAAAEAEAEQQAGGS